jgi:hypothetical protein
MITQKCSLCDKEKEERYMKQCPVCKRWYCKAHYGHNNKESKCYSCDYSELFDFIIDRGEINGINKTS